MQALGNDFIVVDGRQLSNTPVGKLLLRSWRKAAPALARTLCDRHVGVGADGLILLLDRYLLRSMPELKKERSDSAIADIGWIYTNGDGSPSDMCGNGLRCLVLFARNRGLASDNELTISTDAGDLCARFESAEKITIDVGVPKLRSEQIPLAVSGQEQFVAQSLSTKTSALSHQLIGTCVNMGNPHVVIFDEYTKAVFNDPHLAAQAAEIQSSSMFPEGVNVEFATVRNLRSVRVLVWERGCGATLACASGAAATVVAGVLEKKLARECTVELPGGSLSVSWSESDNHVRITGSATEVFDAQIDLLKFDALRGLLPAEAPCSK